MSQRVIRGLWIAAGSFSLILGFIGIFLPLLPTIPLLLLAAACYLRGSDRMHKWITSNKLFGAYIRNYREGIPLKAKFFSLLLVWITMGYSVVFVVHILLVRLFLILIALGVTAHLLSIKTPDQSSF